MDSDELAVLTAMVLEELGIPFRYVMKGDGKNWVSVEVLPLEEKA
jgi:hypothetical protein